MKENPYAITIKMQRRDEVVIEKHQAIREIVDSTSGATEPDSKNSKNFVFFSEEYRKADSIVNQFIDKTDMPNVRLYDSEEYCQNYKRRTINSIDDNKTMTTRNNTIVFTGQRGSGKTSAMISFGRYLSEKRGEFELLDLIDPSLFKKNESILINVITLMFRDAKEYGYKNNEITSEFNQLLREFEKVFKAVMKMDSSLPGDHSLEHLNDLSNSASLEKDIHHLINEYLRFKGSNNNGNSQYKRYLVLMIDDLDMNVSYAQEMLEQIRKYLIQDNLIILVATNIDQLHLELKEAYAQYFKATLKPCISTPDWNAGVNVGVDVEDMATKYLFKLFPPMQRIHLSDIAHKLTQTDLIIKNDGTTNTTDESVITGDLQKVILTMIWERTRLIFIPQEGMLHPIIPTNLRALRQFIFMLLDMNKIPDIYKEDTKLKEVLITYNEMKAVKENFYKFKDYILNVWIPFSVSFEEKTEFDNIPKEIGRINKHLIQAINVIGAKYKRRLLLKDLYKGHEGPKPDDVSGIRSKRWDQSAMDRDIYTFVSPNDPRFAMANKIADVYNFPSNNSMGDILLLMDKYKTYFEAANANNFIEAVKIYYSLLLFETMFLDERSLVKITHDPKITSIQKLIGGTMYFPHYFNIWYNEDYQKKWKELSKKIGTLDHKFHEIKQEKRDTENAVHIEKGTNQIISNSDAEFIDSLIVYINNKISKDKKTLPSEVDIEKIIKDIDTLDFKTIAETDKNKNERNKFIFKLLYKKYYDKQDDVEEHLFYHDYVMNTNDFENKFEESFIEILRTKYKIEFKEESSNELG